MENRMSTVDTSAFAALTAALAKEIGIPEAVPSSDGIFRLEMDGIPLSCIRQGASILLYSSLGNLPDDPAQAEAARILLLSANVLFRGTGGASLGIRPEDGMVILCWKAPMQSMSEGEFLTNVENFLNFAEHWTKRLENVEAAPADRPAQAPPVGSAV
jgi:hypothetical protein